MALWPTVRRVATLLVLLLAATEIFACDLGSSPTCLFSTHATNDSGQECSGDGCLCCCAHIVVVAPISLAPLGVACPAASFEDVQTPDVSLNGIDHPPRF